MENNLPEAEFDALKSLIRNKELITQNTEVFLNRKDYISKMKLILVDTSRYKKIQIDESKVLNHFNLTWKMKLLNFSKKNKKLLIKRTKNYTLQAQYQLFYTVFVKSTKVLLMGSDISALYCQLKNL